MEKREFSSKKVHSEKDEQQSSNFLFEENLSEIDPDTDLIIGFEENRQAKKLILIPSESICPRAVRQALGSVFTNLYAEGYPPLRMTRDEEKQLLDFKNQLAHYRRYADRRFYKGGEYVNFVEALAQRRAAECFATDKNPHAPIKISADEIFVNVQPLSGAAANNSVYEAFVQPGDTVMGMALAHGGHLTHGSEFNRSGRRYNVVSYGVNEETERLNYQIIRRLAIQHKPKMIIAGYTSYPWAPDWQKFRRIADTVGAILFADIAHPAGLVIAGQYPSPVGYADVITLTTHKTLCGPRGAVILSTDEEKAQRIDNAVFPGEQGGPHVNKFAAMAAAFKIAQMPKFKKLQEKIVENAKVLASSLKSRGLKIAYGGTNTHLLVIDLRAVETRTGFSLKGEIAARILDLCGLVVNKNTIPGDETAADASGIRLGTPWITQRGLGKEEMEKLAELIQRVLTRIQPFSYIGLKGDLPRGKIDLETLEEVKQEVAELVRRAEAETSAPDRAANLGYPHYHPSAKSYLKETSLLAVHRKLGAKLVETNGWRMPLHYQNFSQELKAVRKTAVIFDLGDMGLLKVSGERAKPFLQGISTNNLARLKPGELLPSFLLDGRPQLIDEVSILYLDSDNRGRDHYLIVTNRSRTEKVKSWLRGLSDGYITFDRDDIFAKVEGPAVVEDLGDSVQEGLCRIGIGLYGPDSCNILSKIEPSLANLKKFHFRQGKIGDIEGIISRAGYNGDSLGFEFYIHPNDAIKLWNLLLRQGKEFGIKAAGLQVRNQLRSEAGLPSNEETEFIGDGVSLYKAHPSYFDLSKPYFIGQKIINKALGSWAAKKEEFQYKEEKRKVRQTPLYQEHLKLGASFVTFAGWKMPLCYTGISEEHRAVREAAGLFDVTHMGVIEIAGEHAASLLDMVSSNYVRWLKDGQSHYAYLLAPDGNILDDVMIYRRGRHKYMMVLNAVNEKKIWTWLNAVNSEKFLIDQDYPNKEVEGKAVLKNLKSSSSGKDQKADLALQGPNSAAILQKLAKEPELKRKLARIARNEFIETELTGIEMIISRSGYTGETIGYELYLHPENATLIWDLLLKEGQQFGIKPAGLGARDSTRIEAGLPLYGHELAGKHGITATEAGYGAFVKLHKPYFIGKKRLMERQAQRKMEIIRFKMKSKGIKMAKSEDPIVDERGQYIGRVTSCALVEGIQLGMAYVDKNFAQEGRKISIFMLARGGRISPEAPKDKLTRGDKVLLDQEAVVLSRFPEEKSKPAV
ncbi:glycine cleavage system protein T [Candidatus Aerophobetes bacterium Ae_b3a]|nr:MAG: glycine cleavage system protein T [Candidatus Aerophobetes bacterium Ae_b3a]